MSQEPIQIIEGMVLRCDTLRWDDGWEFGHPLLMLSPVVKCCEDIDHERLTEGVLIDAVISGSLESDDFEDCWGWRGWKLPVLRRRFREALAGKKFPIAGYRAERSYVRIIRDEDEPGSLTFADEKHGEAMFAAWQSGCKFIEGQLA